jgi:hypothetical protein
MKGVLSVIIEKNEGLPSSVASAFGSAGITTTKDGTYSSLISDGNASSSGTDYLNSKTGKYDTNPAGRAAYKV